MRLPTGALPLARSANWSCAKKLHFRLRTSVSWGTQRGYTHYPPSPTESLPMRCSNCFSSTGLDCPSAMLM
eukprot:191659-Amphidinium_carterae.1